MTFLIDGITAAVTETAKGLHAQLHYDGGTFPLSEAERVLLEVQRQEPALDRDPGANVARPSIAREALSSFDMDLVYENDQIRGGAYMIILYRKGDHESRQHRVDYEAPSRVSSETISG